MRYDSLKDVTMTKIARTLYKRQANSRLISGRYTPWPRREGTRPDPKPDRQGSNASRSMEKLSGNCNAHDIQTKRRTLQRLRTSVRLRQGIVLDEEFGR